MEHHHHQQSNPKKKNSEFYKDCTTYFEYLRKKGDTDDNFEDEYFFTLPAISGGHQSHMY